MISVESTAETIHVRIPRAEVSDARLAQLLRGLRLETAIAGSQLTDADADAMAEEMKTDWWARNEHRSSRTINNNPPQQFEVQPIADKADELINALRR